MHEISRPRPLVLTESISSCKLIGIQSREETARTSFSVPLLESVTGKWSIYHVGMHRCHCQQCNDTHAKRFLAFLSGNLALLFLRWQCILNVFKFRSFVKSLSMLIESLLTTIFFLETKSLPSIPTKRYESEPDLPKPKLLLPNAGRSNRHCLSIEKTPNRQRSGKLTMSSRLAGWSPRLC